MTNLPDRFGAFIKTLPGFESIDELLRSQYTHGKKRADYLVRNRRIIIEQKVLVVDPAEKPQRFIDELIGQGRILVTGRTPWSESLLG